jgi:hypothetical protein
LAASPSNRLAALPSFTIASTAAPLWLSPEVSDVSIPSAQVLKHDHVVYQINVCNVAKLSAFSRWTVLKRFQDFVQLDAAIRRDIQHNSEQITSQLILDRLPFLPRKESKVSSTVPRYTCALCCLFSTLSYSYSLCLIT